MNTGPISPGAEPEAQGRGLARGSEPCPIKRVHFIEFNAKVNTLAIRRIFPKYGTPLLAAILKERGYDVRIYLEGVSRMKLEEMADCDVVCFPVFAAALNKVKACAQELRRAKPGLRVIAGGPQACMYPQTLVDFCDIVVRCEGDEILPELLECLARGSDWRAIPGLSFRDGGQVVYNPDRTPPPVPETLPDLRLIEGFNRARWGLQQPRVVNALQTSRGCHFKCAFCPTPKLFGGTYRTRSIDAVIRDIRARRRYNPVFFVVDNSFVGNRRHTTELLHRLVKEDLGVHLIVFERHEIGQDDDLLQLMARAGVRCIIVGVESLEDENLQAYHKRQVSQSAVEAIANIQRHGIHALGTFVLGGDADTKDQADRIVRFVEQSGISLNLFIVHDLEENPARGLFIPLNRRFQAYYQRTDPTNTDYLDYLTGNFATYFPKRMKPSTLQNCVLDIYARVFTHHNILARMWSKNLFDATFGVAHGYGLKRMTNTMRAVLEGGYLEHLYRIEDGLYDANEVLIEDRLAELDRLPIPKPIEEQGNWCTYEGLLPLVALPGLSRYGWLLLRHWLRGMWPADARSAT